MAQRTITRMYDRYTDAQAVVGDLEASGIPHSDISLVAHSAAQGATDTTSPAHAGANPGASASTGAGAGAVLGTALGGGVGLLAGIGALAIPAIGPVVAAGWLVATLTGAGVGAASGGLIGSLTGAGVGHDEANVYAEGVRSGGSLVTVRIDESDAARVEDVMQRHGPVDWQQRRGEYGDDWTGFDETSSSRIRGGVPGRSATDVGTASGTEAYSVNDPVRRP